MKIIVIVIFMGLESTRFVQALSMFVNSAFSLLRAAPEAGDR